MMMNYEMLISILHSFLNRSIDIIMDCYYNGNQIEKEKSEEYDR